MLMHVCIKEDLRRNPHFCCLREKSFFLPDIRFVLWRQHLVGKKGKQASENWTVSMFAVLIFAHKHVHAWFMSAQLVVNVWMAESVFGSVQFQQAGLGGTFSLVGSLSRQIHVQRNKGTYHTTVTTAAPGRQRTVISNIDSLSLFITDRRKWKLKALSVNKY